MKKKLLCFFLLLFSVFKLQSQTTAGYLSDVTQPWYSFGLTGNIDAMNSVYGTDWTQYNYNTVNAAALFDSNRRFIWIEGSDNSTSKMLTFLAANTALIENWVNAGGTLLINTATNEALSPYNVGFGVTSTRGVFTSGLPFDTSSSFFALSPYLPIIPNQYTGTSFAHNFFSGPGLEKILVSPTGEIILAEKKTGSGLVRFSGLTTGVFASGSWIPKPQILNLLYRMISKLSQIPFVTLIDPVAIACSGESGSVQFRIDDQETLPADLLVSASSSNQALIPNANLILSGTGATRSLGFTGLANQTGTSTITVTVTDEDSNTFTTTFIVTVKDTEAPVVQTQNKTVQLDNTGKVTITADDIDNGSTDNCGIATKVLSKNSFNFNDIGDNIVTLTVTDVNGNTSSKTAIVTIPLNCPADIVVNNNGPGECGAVVNYYFKNNHASNVLILNSYSFYSALDIKQKLENTHEFDNVDVISLSSFIPDLVVLQKYDAILVCTAYGEIGRPGLGDVLAQYIDSGGGIVDALFENSSQPITGLYNTNAYRVLVPTDINLSGVLSLGTIDIPNHPIMKDVATFTGGYRSGSTNITPGSHVVSRYNNNDMLVIAKENVGLNNAKRVSLNFYPASTTVDLDGWDSSTDGAKIIANSLKWTGKGLKIKQISGLPNGSLFPVGTTTNTFEITDKNNIVHTCSFKVTVKDSELPVVKAKNITVQLDALGKATIAEAEINDGSTDNCAIATITLDKKDFDCTNIGDNTVTLTVTDVNGNSDSKTATVTVEDKVKPIVVTQNIIIQLDALGKATITAAEINDGSTDICGITTMTLDKTTFDCANIGDNTVTLTVTDVNGNSDSKTATVTVEDKIKPIVNTQNITIQLDASGNAVITETEIDNGSTDICGITTMTLDKKDFDCSNIGDNTVTLTVTDVNGNSDSKTATVTVEDKVKPIVVTQNITIQLDASGKETITAAEINDGSTDNCGIDEITLDKKDFDCTNVGDNIVTLTVTDVNGNSDSKTATVTVEDKVKPIAITQNITVQLDALGKATITATEIDNGSTDNCGIDEITLDKKDFDCANIGDNTVTLTVTDVNGNSDSKTATVTVEDKIKPIAITQNITVQLDALGKATITATEIDNGSTDNCAIATITLDKTDFDCSNIGANTVTLTVADVNGNSVSGTAVVTVKDLAVPTVITQNITVQLDATGSTAVIPALINNGSTDNCSIAAMTLDKTTFDCSNIGANTVTLTVTDVNGNSASNTATVTVEDKINPIVVTQNIIIELDATGNAVLTAAQINNGSTDNCEIATMTLDKTTFDCSNIGDNNLTLNLIDKSGNSAFGTAVVTVKDLTAPTVVSKNITVQLDATGNAAIIPALINNGSTDNCAIATMTLDKTTFDCSNIGDNTVILTVTDVNGNSASKTATVTVEDIVKPIVVTQNTTVQLDAAGSAVITAAEINNGSTDNCSIATMTIDKTNFNCSNIGPNIVTLTVTDSNGNVASKTAIVTVEDRINPVVVTQNITIQLTLSGDSVITAAQINNGSSDNCVIDKMTLDKTTFNCSNLGDNTVTLTVKDKSGNQASATAIVTVLPLSPPVFTSLMQDFCAIENPTVATIGVNSTNVKWFINASSSQPLSSSAALTSGTYYAAIYNGTCYSDRVAVTINVKDALVPTGNAVQYICREKEATITDLITNEEQILWYESASGGLPLSAATVLEDHHNYYASYVGDECESSKRLQVEVVFRYCDVKVYNGISANGDGKNDYFAIEGVTAFPDNKLEIFNSWGSLVFEATRYGDDDNLFRGFANKGLGSGKGLLPFGTYYYVFSFTNHDNKRITKKGFLHLNP
ncbi:T9SS type B sorting domain-containing protein [Flavobacterium aquidurense]|uniref:T9SS type B sorting domain-containing protein n=1 Tax=Flavobacterium aquidurense TaxID=362413 RepID=UPI0037114CC3